MDLYQHCLKKPYTRLLQGKTGLNFGAGLAATELAAQQKNAAVAVKRLGEAAEALTQQIKQKGRLFESLGLLSGLALALLVI